MSQRQDQAAAPRRRFVRQAGQARYVSLADGAVYAEWGDGVMVHLFRKIGVRFEFKVWSEKGVCIEQRRRPELDAATHRICAECGRRRASGSPRGSWICHWCGHVDPQPHTMAGSSFGAHLILVVVACVCRGMPCPDPWCRFSLTEAEAALRAKADYTTNVRRRRGLRLFLALLDWAKEAS